MEIKELLTVWIVLMHMVQAKSGFKGTTRRTAFQQKGSEASAPRMKSPDWNTGSVGSNLLSDVLEYTMYIEGYGQVELHLVRDRFLGLPGTLIQDNDGKIVSAEVIKQRSEGVAFYTDLNGHGSFACISHQTQDGHVFCELVALFEIGDESCYIGTGTTDADCTAANTGLLKFYDMPPIGHSRWKPAGTATVSHSRRKRRSSRTKTSSKNASTRLKRAILPEPGHKTVEIAFMIDDAFMTLFYNRHPDNETAAKNEAILYVTLMTNEMNVYLATIADTSGGSTDIYAYPADIVIPKKGTDFAWLYNHKDGKYLRADDNFDIGLRQAVNSGFTTRQWDHVMALTGLDLFDVDSNSGNLLGYAYRSTVCYPSWHYYSAYKYSINEVQSYNIGRIAAHELGHALGMTHDGGGDGCPEDTYIMSPRIFRPSSGKSTTFFRFSTCSVTDLEKHLKGMPNCTMDNGFTQAQFKAFFCSGLPGSQDNSLDRQCQRITGWSGSTACDIPSSDTDCYERYRIQCRTEGGSCGPSLKYVWNGTPCGTEKVCYKGRCVDKFSICELSTTSPTNTTSTTTTTTATTTSTSTTPSTTSTTTTTKKTPTTTSPKVVTTTLKTVKKSNCSCCGIKRNKRRRRCCKTGLTKIKSDCYCCGSLKKVEEPRDWTGKRF